MVVPSLSAKYQIKIKLTYKYNTNVTSCIKHFSNPMVFIYFIFLFKELLSLKISFKR